MPRLSVIVPVGPDDGPDPALIDQLTSARARLELIVSVPAGHPLELPAGVRKVSMPRPGRGLQLNGGAARARADWLWFVHADSRLASGALPAVEQFLSHVRPAIGYCRLAFLDDGPALTRLNAIGANLRSRLFGLPYGDQGYCMPAAWFQLLGGFREDLARGEDLDFIARARRAGLRTELIDTRIHTSARRYRRHGWLRTTVAHQRAAWRLLRDAGSAPEPNRHRRS